MAHFRTWMNDNQKYDLRELVEAALAMRDALKEMNDALPTWKTNPAEFKARQNRYFARKSDYEMLRQELFDRYDNDPDNSMWKRIRQIDTFFRNGKTPAAYRAQHFPFHKAG